MTRRDDSTEPRVTLSQYLAAVSRARLRHPHQKRGETYLAVLHDLVPTAAAEIVGTDLDPSNGWRDNAHKTAFHDAVRRHLADDCAA